MTALSFFARNMKTMAVEAGLYMLLQAEGDQPYSVGTLCETLGYSERRVYYAVKKLIELGYAQKAGGVLQLVAEKPVALQHNAVSTAVQCSSLQHSAAPTLFVNPLKAYSHNDFPNLDDTCFENPAAVSYVRSLLLRKHTGIIPTSGFLYAFYMHVLYIQAYTSIYKHYMHDIVQGGTEMRKKDDTQLPLLPGFEEKARRESGYRSSDYAEGGWRHNLRPKTDGQAFVRFFLEEIYSYRGIDFKIPEHKVRKYYARAKAIIEALGSLDNAKSYIRWFITEDTFKKTAFSVDLLVTDSVVERFKVSERGKRIRSTSDGYIATVEEAKNNRGGLIL